MNSDYEGAKALLTRGGVLSIHLLKENLCIGNTFETLNKLNSEFKGYLSSV